MWKFYRAWSIAGRLRVYKVYPDTTDKDVNNVDESMEHLFVETVQVRRQAMYRVAYGILRSAADAEDAVSAAVEAVWRRLNSLRSADALPAYLMRATINTARSELRKRCRVIPVEDVYDSAAPQDGDVAGYISHMAEKYRLPLMLKFGEGMNEREIAAVLRLPRGTVSSRISRGLTMLRKDLTEEEWDHA